MEPRLSSMSTNGSRHLSNAVSINQVSLQGQSHFQQPQYHIHPQGLPLEYQRRGQPAGSGSATETTYSAAGSSANLATTAPAVSAPVSSSQLPVPQYYSTQSGYKRVQDSTQVPVSVQPTTPNSTTFATTSSSSMDSSSAQDASNLLGISKKKKESTLFQKQAGNYIDISMHEDTIVSSDNGAMFTATVLQSVSSQSSVCDVVLERSSPCPLKGDVTVEGWNLTFTSGAWAKTSIKCCTNQAIINAMRKVNPLDDANQTNQRLRRQWRTPRFFRFHKNDGKLVKRAVGLKDSKIRAGIIFIEWPEDKNVIELLIKQKQEHRTRSEVYGNNAINNKRVKQVTKDQLDTCISAARSTYERLVERRKRLLDSLANCDLSRLTPEQLQRLEIIKARVVHVPRRYFHASEHQPSSNPNVQLISGQPRPYSSSSSSSNPTSASSSFRPNQYSIQSSQYNPQLQMYASPQRVVVSQQQQQQQQQQFSPQPQSQGSR